MLALAVVGRDVSRSLSPKMHRFLLGEMGEECVYDKVSLPPEAFAAEIPALLNKYDGLNITIPYKREIMPYLAEIRGDAALFGAVNTVLCHGRIGENTDGFGFLLLLENAGISVSGKRVLVLGAGGAGRSCIAKLAEKGAEVSVFSRTYGRVLDLFRETGGFRPLPECPNEPFDLIVNCTGVGMHGTEGVSPVGEELLAKCGGAVDLIYEPRESEFLRLAAKHGKLAVNGETMLFYQAYGADCLYLGMSPSAAEAKRLYECYRRTDKGEETL